MKLSGAAAAAFCGSPEAGVVAVLLYGPDAGLVALRRQELVRGVTDGDDMRLTRLDAAEARKDPAAIDEALRAQGFFPGRRVVLIERATDALSKLLEPLLGDIAGEDALLVVEADNLPPRSSLRKLFEGPKRLVAAGLWPEPPDAGELEAMLREAGLEAGLSPDAEAELLEAAGALEAGPLHRLVEVVALYGRGASAPLDAEEVRALLPARTESGVERLVDAVAEGEVGAIGPVLARLGAAGVTPVSMLIQTGRHFRQLLGVAVSADGPDRALQRLRPPPRGRRRDRMLSQARRWGAPRLERALRTIFAADLALRSPGTRPDRAMVERTLIRVAMMAGR